MAWTETEKNQKIPFYWPHTDTLRQKLSCSSLFPSIKYGKTLAKCPKVLGYIFGFEEELQVFYIENEV